jgi:serine/threonine protein kinase
MWREESIVLKVRFFYKIEGVIWGNVSEQAKDLISRMLTYDSEKRITAEQAYKHKWFEGKKFNTLPPERTQELISNINEFYVFYYFNLKVIRQTSAGYYDVHCQSINVKEGKGRANNNLHGSR